MGVPRGSNPPEPPSSGPLSLSPPGTLGDSGFGSWVLPLGGARVRAQDSTKVVLILGPNFFVATLRLDLCLFRGTQTGPQNCLSKMLVDCSGRHLLPPVLWLCGSPGCLVGLSLTIHPRKDLHPNLLESFRGPHASLRLLCDPSIMAVAIEGCLSRTISEAICPTGPVGGGRSNPTPPRVSGNDVLETTLDPTLLIWRISQRHLHNILVVTFGKRSRGVWLDRPQPIIGTGNGAIKEQQPSCLHVLDGWDSPQQLLHAHLPATPTNWCGPRGPPRLSLDRLATPRPPVAKDTLPSPER